MGNVPLNIGIFGRKSMGLFPKVSVSITKMAIVRIIALKIWN